MNCFVYILYSESAQKFYVGQTENIADRFEKHNTGQFLHSSTKYGIPWQLFLVIECDSRKQAVNIEAHIKKMRSVKYYHSLKSYPEATQRLKERYKRCIE